MVTILSIELKVHILSARGTTNGSDLQKDFYAIARVQLIILEMFICEIFLSSDFKRKVLWKVCRGIK
jgi:hypothetical protein